MRKKNMTMWLCTAALAVSLAGCGAGTDPKETVVQETQQTAAETTEASEEESDVLTVQVTEIDGNTITAETGTLRGAGISVPDGKIPDKIGNDENGIGPGFEDEQDETEQSGDAAAEAPDKPDGEAPDKENTGNAPGGPAPGGRTFEGNGETVTLTLTDSTNITVEFLQGSQDGSIDDISVGSVLAVTLDDDGNPTQITVKNLNAGGGFGGSDTVTNGTSAATIDTAATITGETYTSSGDDENALRVDGADAVLENVTIEKTGGASSNTENGDFYGQNAAFLALNGANVTITDASFTTDAINGNGVFSYGEGTTVTISDSTIRTSQNNSGGIQTTGGGTTYARNLDVETQGNSAAAIRSDRGGGNVYVEGGTYTTGGTGSPAIYCTADIEVSDAVLTANASESVVVEGKNSVSLTNCTLTGDMKNTYNGDSDENIHAIMIYQSMSGDAALGEASFSAEGGSITAKTGDLFYVTNTDCTISLKSVDLTLANDVLLRVEGNSSSRGWGTAGSNGGDVTMTASAQTLEGNILVDSISSLALTLADGSSWTGAVNPDGDGGEVSLILDESSTWTLTGDSYLTSFEGDLDNIIANGFHLYVAGEQVL